MSGIHPNRLALLRERNSLTQREVALRSGFAMSTVCKHERGLRGMTKQDILVYAQIFGVDTHELFFDPDELSMFPAEEEVAV